ncbi:hypothetical protein H0H93_010211 [Arthromyces matolae]|nr:hypothetical protein H0H93_010211 [Arthromyces matolae]
MGQSQESARPTTILHRTPWTPPVAKGADGIYIDLEDGRRVLDGVGGAAVACLGNSHPKVMQAMKDQIDKVSYVYNMQLSNQPAEALANKLITSSNGAFSTCGFVCGVRDQGTEAMESVIKLGKQYYIEVGQPQRKNYIARRLSFHGNSIATLSLAYHPARRGPYVDLLNKDCFHHVSPAYAKRFQKPDETEEQYVERLRQELEDKFIALGPDTVIGFVAETVVGATTGVVPAPNGYFKGMGTLHGWQSFGDNVAPDVQAVAKGLGGGYAAIGAVLMSKKVADGIKNGSGLWKHGHTYQGHPLSCAAALAVQNVIESENLLENIRTQGAYLKNLLETGLRGPNAVAAPYTFDIRGGGGFWGIEFDFTNAANLDFGNVAFAFRVQARALENGLVIIGMTGGSNLEGTKGDHIILAPAYIVTKEEIEKIAAVFVQSVEEARRLHLPPRSHSGINGLGHVLNGITTYPSTSRKQCKHQADQEPSAPSTDSKTLRSSARVKAAKLKSKQLSNDKDRDSAAQQSQQPSSSAAPLTDTVVSRATRSTTLKSKRSGEAPLTKGKSKASETDETTPRSTRRTRRGTSSLSAPLTINEPASDPKGKKRAAPEPASDEETTAGPSKRPRISPYSLRSNTQSEMPRKTRASNKDKMASVKTKISVASSSRVEDEDVEMLDTPYKPEPDAFPDENEDSASMGVEDENHDEGDDDDDDDEEGDHEEPTMTSNDGPPAPTNMDAATAMAIFGDYRQFGSYMLSLSSRLKTMLNNIKSSADPTTRLLTLQELSELLSISTEDTLAGSFQVEQFVRELVRILGGQGADDDDDDDADDDHPEQDEDAALAAALAMSTGNAFHGDDNLEAQVLACRCLANLMEALPGVAHTVVYHGAIPVLCSKLIEISYIDLAEQTLSTMEKISEEFPSSIVREGGLAALLNYLDFFSIAVQRTALQAASNCCRNVATEHFPMIKGVWPIIGNCLTYSDQRLVEFSCLCVIRVIDSYHRSSIDNLEALVDTDLIKAVNTLLLPAGGSPLIAPNTYTLLLRSLATAARASPKITVALLEADLVDTLYQILTGVLPPLVENGQEQGSANSGQGLGGGLADMTVMENLAHRPKDQVEEALSLASELMPPLPKGTISFENERRRINRFFLDGVFDHKSYTEKALARMVKAKVKADRASAKQAALTADTAVTAPEETSDITPPETSAVNPSAEATPMTSAPATLDRTELLRSKPVVVGRFMQLIVPILIDVYAASVITPVRVKTLTGLLKAISFLDADGVKQVLTFVPVASFASSILSSKDHPSLVLGALQLVDLLLAKIPTLYKPSFRREGVFHEIEALASRTITSSKSKSKDKDKESETPPDSGSISPPPPASTSTSGPKKLSSLSLEPEDAITLRSRVIQFKYLSSDTSNDEANAFATLRLIVDRFSSLTATDKELYSALRELAELFASPHTSVSSFELVQSGVVEGLLQFATDSNRTPDVRKRQELLLDAFCGGKPTALNGAPSPLTTLVKKLQESLTRMENFDVVTLAQNTDDSKRSSPSLLARQLRLRLVAGDDSDIPRNLHNIVVSIHAIATFEALHDYLRPRVAGLLNGSRLQGMLAALAGFAGANPEASASASQSNKPPAAPAPDIHADSPPSASTTGGRRRSKRLSAKSGGGPSSMETDPVATPQLASGNSAPQATSEAGPSSLETAPSDPLIDSELQADFTDDEEIDADVFDDDVDPDQSMSEKTVMVSVAEDGSKVEAQTPDGTRVATPSASSKDGPLPSSLRTALSNKATYAAALKANPADWHLEFSMDDHVLPLNLTIYGAVHQHEVRKKSGASPASMIWQGIYTIKFKKVTGPAVTTESRGDVIEARARSPSPPLSSLPDDAHHAKILRLLRALHQLNTLEAERLVCSGEKRNLPESAFVNNKLTAKLTRQLEEPMIVASSCLPDWALDLPQHFPFLFPFATRYNFLQSTSFGYARLILKWQSQQNRTQDSSRRDDSIGFLGRLQRQKVRISRKHILESAVKVFELYGSSSSILEVEYFEEVGTGLGPTLEFYSLVSKEFARKDLKIWRDTDALGLSPHVGHPSGLYPAPLNADDIASDGGAKRTHLLRVIGQFVAKAMLDSRIIDLTFNKIFLKLVLGEDVPLSIASLKLVDIDLANSMEKLQSIATSKSHLPNDKLSRKIAKIESISIEDLALDFTLPGYDIELKPGGRDIAVTSDNVEEYISAVLDAILGSGAMVQAKAFRDGFSKVFPVTDLQAFSADELVMLFGNSEEDWSAETLTEAVKADHGFNVESRAIHDLIEIISAFDSSSRRAFLQFITGSPKLPIGGFRGLNPPMTVVRKPHETPLTADDYLPSVMTCVNYLKLPEYSSKVVMAEKLRIAIQEGLLAGSARNVMENALFAIHMCVQKLWCAYATNAISELMEGDVLYAVLLEYQTLIIVRNAHGLKRIAMAAPRLSTLARVELTSSTKDDV